MLTNIALFLGGATSFLMLTELLMSDQQKQALSDKTLHLWSKLDDTKKHANLGWLYVNSNQWIVASSFGLAAFTVLMLLPVKR